MKLTILLVMMLLLSFSKILSQSQYNTPKKEDNFLEIQTLIRTDFKENRTEIFEKSRFLNDREKYYIYNEYKSEGGIPFVINMLTPFGIGSYVQGDYAAGFTFTLMQLAGITLAGSNTPTYIRSAGIYAIVMSYIAGLVRPWIYASSFNTDLKTALRANNIQDFSLNPNLKMLANGQVYPEMSLKIMFNSQIIK